MERRPCLQKTSPGNAAIVDALTNAVIDKRSLRIRYDTLNTAETRDRTVDPYAVYFDPDGATLKLIAYDHYREKILPFSVDRTLFRRWDYQDSGFSLRWDPIEDQRYALRWRDPSKSNLKDGPGTMTGANSLAIEALQWGRELFNTLGRY